MSGWTIQRGWHPDLKLDKFRAFLSSVPQDEIIGRARNTDDCAIVSFGKTIAEEWSCTSEVIMRANIQDGEIDEFLLPKWAKKIAEEEDKRESGTPINAGEYVSMLEEICGPK